MSSAAFLVTALLLPGAEDDHHARPQPSGVLLNDLLYTARYDIVPKTRVDGLDIVHQPSLLFDLYGRSNN